MKPESRALLRDSAAFCMLPWTHLSVEPDGAVVPCCVSAGSVGSLRETRLEEAWNSPVMRGLRRDMLAGRLNPSCGVCHQRDDAGSPSLRRWANERFAGHFGEVEATGADGGLARMRIPYLDVRFSNLCNFRCRTCGPGLSSAWYADAEKLGEPFATTRTVRPTADPKELWRQIEELLPGVEEIRFQGGEPLLMKEHYDILEALLKRGRTGVILRYNTNFSVMTHQGRDALRLWDDFESVFVAASLDAAGARGEYLRKGQDWAKVVENRERMMSVCPRAQFQIAPTVSVFNALHLPDFHRDWVERGYIGANSVHLNPLFTPRHYNVQALPEPFKRRVTERCEAHIDGFLKGAGEAQAHFRGLVEFMRAGDLSGELGKFRERTARLDAIRGERCAEVFPELAELLYAADAAR